MLYEVITVAPMFWSGVASLFTLLIIAIFFLVFRIYKYKKRIVSLRFDRDRYAEVV